MELYPVLNNNVLKNICHQAIWKISDEELWREVHEKINQHWAIFKVKISPKINSLFYPQKRIKELIMHY